MRGVTLAARVILDVVSDESGVPVGTICGPEKAEEVSRARQLAWWFLREYSGLTTAEIATITTHTPGGVALGSKEGQRKTLAEDRGRLLGAKIEARLRRLCIQELEHFLSEAG